MAKTNQKGLVESSLRAAVVPSWPQRRIQSGQRVDAKIYQKTVHLGIDVWKDFGEFWEVKWKQVGTKIDSNLMPYAKRN